jgi:DNA primase
MRFRGREINVVALWENYVEFSHSENFSDKYFDKVQCPNPEHDTLKRHFQINQEDGLVHCFAQCGISGTFSHAIQMIEGCNEKEAHKIILRHATDRKRLHANRSQIRQGSERRDTGTATVVPDLSFSTYIPAFGTDYLNSRKISSSSIAKWELGWDEKDRRIVIPAKDENGQTRFLIRRAVTDQQWPKYLYTEGAVKNSLLFGSCNVSLGLIRSDGMILVEGSLDAIRLHQHGFSNACAILGTGISKAQAEIVARMRPKRVYFMFDKDVSGVHNIEIAKGRLKKYPLFVCKYPTGRFDPAELTKGEVKRAISNAVPISTFYRSLTRTRKGVKIGN